MENVMKVFDQPLAATRRTRLFLITSMLVKLPSDNGHLKGRPFSIAVVL